MYIEYFSDNLICHLITIVLRWLSLKFLKHPQPTAKPGLRPQPPTCQRCPLPAQSSPSPCEPLPCPPHPTATRNHAANPLPPAITTTSALLSPWAPLPLRLAVTHRHHGPTITAAPQHAHELHTRACNTRACLCPCGHAA